MRNNAIIFVVKLFVSWKNASTWERKSTAIEKNADISERYAKWDVPDSLKEFLIFLLVKWKSEAFGRKFHTYATYMNSKDSMKKSTLMKSSPELSIMETISENMETENQPSRLRLLRKLSLMKLLPLATDQEEEKTHTEEVAKDPSTDKLGD